MDPVVGMVAVAVIAALPGLVAAVLGLMTRGKVGALAANVEETGKRTDGRLDELLALTRKDAEREGHAAGLKEGRMEGHAEGMALGGAQAKADAPSPTVPSVGG